MKDQFTNPLVTPQAAESIKLTAEEKRERVRQIAQALFKNGFRISPNWEKMEYSCSHPDCRNNQGTAFIATPRYLVHKDDKMIPALWITEEKGGPKIFCMVHSRLRRDETGEILAPLGKVLKLVENMTRYAADPLQQEIDSVLGQKISCALCPGKQPKITISQAFAVSDRALNHLQFYPGCTASIRRMLKEVSEKVFYAPRDGNDFPLFICEACANKLTQQVYEEMKIRSIPVDGEEANLVFGAKNVVRSILRAKARRRSEGRVSK